MATLIKILKCCQIDCGQTSSFFCIRNDAGCSVRRRLVSDATTIIIKLRDETLHWCLYISSFAFGKTFQVMDRVLFKFKQKKFFECVELLNSLPESDNVVEALLADNCRLVCESLIRIMENDPDKLCEMQEQHYMQFEKVISMDAITDSIPIQLKLSSTFNFTFWHCFYNDDDLDESIAGEYLKLLHKGLLLVLGRKVSSESISNMPENVVNSVIGLKELIPTQDHKTVLFILELVVVVILYMTKLRTPSLDRCLSVVDLFIKESNYVVTALESVSGFLEVKPLTLYPCKFSLSGTGSALADLNSDVVGYLHLLKSVLLYLSEDFRGSLRSLQSNHLSKDRSLWHYLVILNAYELENWGLCSGFITKMSALVLEKNLKARLHIVQGKLNCIERNHKEALHHFQSALALCPHCPIAYCYIGQVYAKMGLFDLMLDNFTKLLQAFQMEEPEDDFRANFETALLAQIHPLDEVTEVESYYALAASYGLNENFEDASEAFERVLQLWDDDQSKRKRRTIELPTFLTVLHETAIMNLMSGNLVRAEQIALDAIDQYIPQESHEEHRSGKAVLCKDVDWLQRVIQQELLEIDMEPKALATETLYSEDLLFAFPQNVIGLLILSEIQRIQGVEDHKATLSTVFSMFSKYLASAVGGDGEARPALPLIRALAGKTCVKIAAIQMELSDHLNVEKMLKRALSCNKGDKDALYKYYNFLSKSGKSREAFKLWNTFSKEKESIAIDSLQSFSLRYFLTDKITKRELEKIQQKIESSAVKVL